MGYGDDSKALESSLKKKARNERRLRRSKAKVDENKLSSEGDTESEPEDLELDIKAYEGKCKSWRRVIICYECVKTNLYS